LSWQASACEHTSRLSFFLKIKDEDFGQFNPNLNGKVAQFLTIVGVDSTFLTVRAAQGKFILASKLLCFRYRFLRKFNPIKMNRAA
jgi:hypothetical protein